MKDLTLTDTVWKFLDIAGAHYARMMEERFRMEMHANCLELGMQSPLEHLFWCATAAMCQANYEPFNPDPDFEKGEPVPGKGVCLRPQVFVGKYRVDFVASKTPHFEQQRCSPVVVELDGHDFHDKDKKQRAYEKARDRFLVKQGYRVVHYTGSEIVADPFKAAHEVLSLLNSVCEPEYNRADPLGF